MMTQIHKRRPASPGDAAAKPAKLDRLLDPAFFKALADPTRAALLACITRCGRPCAVTEVAECCSVDLSVVSRHLAQLARSGLLETHRSGRSVHYTARYTDIAKALRDLADEFDRCRPQGERRACC